jgi:hypothetical protein
MRSKRFTQVAATFAVVAGLTLGYASVLWPLSAWLSNDSTGGSGPTLILPNARRDCGAVRQGVVLQPSFPISNAGGRRLILVEKTEACCGQAVDPHRIILAPGDATELTVEVDTARWCGRMQHTVHYTTNDPKLARFALRVNAIVSREPSTDP